MLLDGTFPLSGTTRLATEVPLVGMDSAALAFGEVAECRVVTHDTPGAHRTLHNAAVQ
jgi:hypothetical protein